jgi:hypothetical protein
MTAVLGPPIHAARPLDWTGTLTVALSWLVVLLCALTVLLVRLPGAWVRLVFGSPELVRLVLALFVLLVVLWVRPFVVGRLPRAASLLFGTLTLPVRGGRHRVRVSEIKRVDLEVRPPPLFEVIIVELADGTTREVCPIDWPGAGGLYRALARRISKRPNPTD